MTANYLNKTGFQIVLKAGLLANLTATATLNTALDNEPHYATDAENLYIYNGSGMRLIGGKGRAGGVRAVSAAATLAADDYLLLVDASGGAITITLPAAAGFEGWEFVVKKTDASVNAVTLDGDGAETIDGAATQALATQYGTIKVAGDGSAWHITGGYIDF